MGIGYLILRAEVKVRSSDRITPSRIPGSITRWLSNTSLVALLFASVPRSCIRKVSTVSIFTAAPGQFPYVLEFRPSERVGGWIPGFRFALGGR